MLHQWRDEFYKLYPDANILVADKTDFTRQNRQRLFAKIATGDWDAVIQNATCWEELHAGLDAVGLRFVRKGSGAVIFVGDTAVKASSVDRDFSMSRLCKRLGEFKPGFYSERTFKKPAPEPVSHVCREEWQEYQKERQRLAEERRLARAKREEEREALEQRQKERREAATTRLAPHGLSMLNIARHCLKEQERKEKATLRDRQSQSEKPERLRRFKSWLGKRSPHLGNLWRFRRRIVPGVEVRKRDFLKFGTLSSPYAAYREMVKKRFPEKMDASRLDVAIALYIRCQDTRRRKLSKNCTDTPPPAPTERTVMKG